MSKFSMIQIINKKRDGGTLSAEEIRWFVEEYTKGNVPDYQASALLMAIYFQKMDREETFELTRAMRDSGEVMDLSAIGGIKVDKHSTGGVGDKTTLIVAPLAAACGVPVAKMSGRGLGFTGGTIDKLESIPGFKTSMESRAFVDQVNAIGIAVAGQTAQIAAADKKLYALRDVTATVDNMSLIASSIMSKKLASGSDAIVLDVKCGSGAFMEEQEKAEELAQMMVDIGKDDGKTVIAVLTDMSQPLGRAVGNSLEVIEAIDTLKGKGPLDISHLSLELAAWMVLAAGKASDFEEAKAMVTDALLSGKALEKFKEFVAAQGGDPAVAENYGMFPESAFCQEIYAGATGYVTRVDARIIGKASQLSGAGREKKEDSVDPAAGIYLYKKVGDPIRGGALLARVFGNDDDKVYQAAEEAKKAFTISKEEPAEKPVLVKKVIR
ncbi:MAG: pyrimidine-nucleoside phosphorylase [Clostridiales bacterium]|nr:pyrimidine-nucleoside phosphorylase [Clostridiales bacterium]